MCIRDSAFTANDEANVTEETSSEDPEESEEEDVNIAEEEDEGQEDEDMGTADEKDDDQTEGSEEEKDDIAEQEDESKHVVQLADTAEVNSVSVYEWREQIIRRLDHIANEVENVDEFAQYLNCLLYTSDAADE